MKVLSILRIPNLIIVALTQAMLGFVVLYPIVDRFELQRVLDPLHFSLLIIVTVIIAISGYVINDYFDYEADIINKAHKNQRNQLSKKNIAYLYSLITIIGFCLAIYLASHIGKPLYLWIFIGAQFLLYHYSSKLKIIPGMGNLMVALMCAGVVLVLLLPEAKNLKLLREIDSMKSIQFTGLILSFSLFAFLITIVREIVKDLEDIQGDRIQGKKTLPLALGVENAGKIAVSFTFLLTVAILVWIGRTGGFWDWWNVYLLVATLVPLLMIIFLLRKAKTSLDFGKISQLLKFIMFLGLMYVLIKPV